MCLLWCPLAAGIALSHHIPGGLPPLPSGLFSFACQHLCPILFKLSKALKREVEDKLTHRKGNSAGKPGGWFETGCGECKLAVCKQLKNKSTNREISIQQFFRRVWFCGTLSSTQRLRPICFCAHFFSCCLISSPSGTAASPYFSLQHWPDGAPPRGAVLHSRLCDAQQCFPSFFLANFINSLLWASSQPFQIATMIN